MLVLCGLCLSNYYNKVKLALLEKGVPFEEDDRATPAAATRAMRGASPLGKIPFIRTEQGTLCESQAILEYIEAAYPEPPLLPKDPFAAAKVRELVDLHRPARRAGRARALSEGVLRRHARRARRRARAQALERNIAALRAWRASIRTSPARPFTQADCAAWATFRGDLDGDAGCLRRGPARRRRHRLEAVCEAPRRAAERCRRSADRKAGAGSCAGQGLKRQPAAAPSGRLRRPSGAGGGHGRGRGDPGRHFLAVAIEFLHALEAALDQQARCCAGCARPPCFPRRRRTGSACRASARATPDRAGGSGSCRAGTAGLLTCRLVGCSACAVRRALAISTPTLANAALRLVAELVDRPLHVAQVGAAVARLVLATGSCRCA